MASGNTGISLRPKKKLTSFINSRTADCFKAVIACYTEAILRTK